MEADHITAESKAGSGGAHLSICHEEQLWVLRTGRAWFLPISCCSSKAKQYLCLCSRCSQLTVAENGQELPGQNVSHATRDEHQGRDRLAKLKKEAGISDPQPTVIHSPEIKDAGISIPSLAVFQNGTQILHLFFFCSC
jgi:hypothetical protein